MSTTSCPDGNQLQMFVENLLGSASWRASTLRHVEACRECALIVGDLMLADDGCDEVPELPSPNALLAERFELIRELGRGGSGVVWEARPRAPATATRVAIKVLDIRSPAQRKRMQRREVPLAAKLSAHPAFVEVHEVIELSKTHHAIVMPLLEGCDLEEYVRRVGRLRPADALDILAQLAAAIVWLNRLGVIHRDLTPRNVFLEFLAARRRLRVLDYGLARDQKAKVTTLITAPGTVVGTDRYMAPEQLHAGHVTTTVDIWALGMIAVRLFTGVVSVDGTEAGESFNRHASFESSATWKRMAANAPARLLGLVAASLSHEVARRPSARAWVSVTGQLLRK